MRSIYTVRPEGARWVVTCSGVPSPLGYRDHQGEAVTFARDCAERDLPSRLVVLRRDGATASDQLLGKDRLEEDIAAVRELEATLPAGLNAMPEMEDG